MVFYYFVGTGQSRGYNISLKPSETHYDIFFYFVFMHSVDGFILSAF